MTKITYQNLDYKAFLHEFPTATILLDKNLTVLEASNQWLKKFQQTRTEIKGVDFAELFPTFNTKWGRQLLKVLNDVESLQIQDRLHIDSNFPEGVTWDVSEWKDSKNGIKGLYVRANDLTEVDKLRLKLRKTEIQLTEKGRNAKIGLWEFDVLQQTMEVSTIAKEILGFSSSENPTMNEVIDLFEKGTHRNHIKTLIQNGIEDGSPWNVKLKVITKNNKEIWLRSIGKPKFKNGKCSRLIVTNQDVTEHTPPKQVAKELVDFEAKDNITKQQLNSLRQRNQTLQKNLAEARLKVEHLSNFTNVVSNDLKGHATNFSVLLDFLKTTDLDRDQSKFVSMLQLSTQNLNENIQGLSEILGVSSTVSMRKRSLNLNESIYRAQQRMAEPIRRERVKIINEIPEDFKIKGVSSHLDNILKNCIDNAIQFRRKNVNPVLVFRAYETKDKTVFSIEDNGIGIDLENNLEKLFKPYETLGNDVGSKGTGLYLVKYQTELMNGQIEVTSALNEGSTFEFHLPR